METLSLHQNSDEPATLSQTGYTIMAIIIGVFSVVGVVLNVLVIVVTVKHRELRQPLSFALVNLAVCNLCCATLGGLPTTVTSAMGYFSLGRVGCVLEGFFMGFFGTASLCTISVISVERYIMVCHPFGAVLFQTRHAVAGVVLSWVWSFVWNMPPLFGWGSFELEGVGISCAPNWHSRDAGNMSFILIYLFFCFALPLSIIVVSYLCLLWTLHQVTKVQVGVEIRRTHIEAQVSCMVLVMVLAFLGTWLPYAAMSLAIIIDSSLDIDPLIATLPAIFSKCSTVYNPIIYFFMNRQFRRYAVATVLCV